MVPYAVHFVNEKQNICLYFDALIIAASDGTIYRDEYRSEGEESVGILVLISALVFGLMHIGNIANSASIQMGIAQGIATTFAGIFFIAAYLRTGNILIPIFMHGIYDYMCFTTDPALENGIMANEIAASALILAIWNDKWSVKQN